MKLAPCLCHVSVRSKLEVDRGVVMLDTGKFVIILRVTSHFALAPVASTMHRIHTVQMTHMDTFGEATGHDVHVIINPCGPLLLQCHLQFVQSCGARHSCQI